MKIMKVYENSAHILQIIGMFKILNLLCIFKANIAPHLGSLKYLNNIFADSQIGILEIYSTNSHDAPKIKFFSSNTESIIIISFRIYIF
jgi:hypothetical protein